MHRRWRYPPAIVRLATAACRGVAGSDATAIDHEQQHTLFGTAILAIFMSCVERVDQHEADGRTIEEAVTDLVYKSPSPASGEFVPPTAAG